MKRTGSFPKLIPLIEEMSKLEYQVRSLKNKLTKASAGEREK